MSLKSLPRVFVACLLLLSTCMAWSAVNINTASSEELASQIKGVGKKKAERIVHYRKQHGPFQSVMDLALVKGIGAKTVETNLENLSVGTSSQVKQ